MSKRASSDALDELHAALARHLAAELERAANAQPCAECGQKPGIPPALLAQAIKFLKDNGIDMPAQSGNRVDTLKDEMPDLDEIERGTVVPFRK